MKSALSVRRAAPALLRFTRSFAAVGTQVDTDATVHLQKARTWDQGVSSNFSTTPLREIFQGKKIVIFGLPGAFTGVCTQQHVPSFSKYAEKFKEKGVDSIICVAVNDPYVMYAWADQLQCKEKLDFYGDFDGKFHKHLKLDLDLSSGLLGPRSHRWAAYVENGVIKQLNVEQVPSEFKVSDAKTLYEQI